MFPPFSNFVQRGGTSVTVLEVTGGKGIVQVNGRLYQKGSSVIITGGDELIFSHSGKHAYVSLLCFMDNIFVLGFLYIFVC